MAKGIFSRGYLTIFHYRGAPVRIHWTAPLGALILGGSLLVVPIYWLAFFVLIVMHEIGHAALVRRYRFQVISIDLHGLGGLCRWEGSANPWQRAVIAWGGIWVQLALLVFAGTALMGVLALWT